MPALKSGPRRLIKCPNKDCSEYGVIYLEPEVPVALTSLQADPPPSGEPGKPIVFGPVAGDDHGPAVVAEPPTPASYSSVDYFQAAQLLRANRKLRRANWPAGVFIEIGEHRPHVTKHTPGETTPTREHWRPTHEDVNAADWGTL